MAELSQLVPPQEDDLEKDFRQREYTQNMGYNRKTILYVGGLDEGVDESTMHAAFIPFGEIVNLVIPKDDTTDKHRGFGFVEYEEPDDAKEAMDNMSDSEMHGRVLKVNVAKPNAIKNQAVWAEADKWYENTLAEDAAGVDAEIRQEQNKDAKRKEGEEGEETEVEEPEKKKPRMMRDMNKTATISGRELKTFGR